MDELASISEYKRYKAEIGNHINGDGFYRPTLNAVGSIVRAFGTDWLLKNRKLVVNDLKEKIDQELEVDIIYPSSNVILHLLGSERFLNKMIYDTISAGSSAPSKYYPPQFPNSLLNIDIDFARNQIELLTSQIETFLDFDDDNPTPRNMVIRAAAGSGKTTIISKILVTQYSDNQYIEYYVPNHTLSKQVKEDLIKIADSTGNNEITVNVIRSIDYEDDEGDLCLKKEIALKLSSLGFSFTKYLCGEIQKCEFFNECRYQKQFRNDIDDSSTVINILAHNHLFLHARNKLPEPSLVIIDESFFSHGIEETIIKPDELKEKNTVITEAIYKALIEKRPLLKSLRDNGISPLMLETEAQKYRNPKNKISPEDNYNTQLTNINEQPKRQYLNKLITTIKKELTKTTRDECYSVEHVKKNELDKGKIVIHTRKELTIPPDVPTIFIDADANQKIIGAFRKTGLFAELPVERFAEVHQFNKIFSRNSITQEGSELKTELIDFIERIHPKEKTLIFTTKKIRCILTDEDYSSQLGIGSLRNTSIVHFNKLRGLNDFKDYENVIIIGREQPPPEAMESIAKALWWDINLPLNLISNKSNCYIKEKRGYRMRDGTSRSASIYVHPDKRVQSILEIVRESEITQAIDRLRLVWERTKETEKGKETITRKVYILNDIPVDITVDYLWNWEQLQEFLNIWDITNGSIPLGSQELLELTPITSISGVKKLAKRLKSTVGLIESIINEEVLLFGYKIDASSKGTPAKALISSKHSKPREALEKAINKSVGAFKQLNFS